MPEVDSHLTPAHVAYLSTQRLGRLATVDRDGRHLGESRKCRNLAGNPHVSLVVDDITSLRPPGQAPLGPGFIGEIIRIHPTRVISFGLDEAGGVVAGRG